MVLLHKPHELQQGSWSDSIQHPMEFRSNMPSDERRQLNQLEDKERRGRAAQSRPGVQSAPRVDRSFENPEERCHPARIQKETMTEPQDVFSYGTKCGRIEGSSPHVCRVFHQDVPQVLGEGCSNEMLGVCLYEHEVLTLWTAAAEEFARETVPDIIFKSSMQGGVKGIATVNFRRLVARVLEREFCTMGTFQGAISHQSQSVTCGEDDDQCQPTGNNQSTGRGPTPQPLEITWNFQDSSSTCSRSCTKRTALRQCPLGDEESAKRSLNQQA